MIDPVVAAWDRMNEDTEFCEQIELSLPEPPPGTPPEPPPDFVPIKYLRSALWAPQSSPSDPQYRGRYTGDGASRDGAYHQGTVWSWLMGPFDRLTIEGDFHPSKVDANAVKCC